MAQDPEQAETDRKLTVVWSQDPMWRRTALERWFAGNGRRLATAAFLVVAYACVVLVVGASLAEQLLKPPRRVLGAPDVIAAQAVAQRTDSSLSDEALRAADNAVLRAWWFVPRTQARGTVLVLHGQADNRAAMLGLAEVLLADRYRVLAADARAHGSSGGALATYGVLERGDLRAWADWAQRQFPGRVRVRGRRVDGCGEPDPDAAGRAVLRRGGRFAVCGPAIAGRSAGLAPGSTCLPCSTGRSRARSCGPRWCTRA